MNTYSAAIQVNPLWDDADRAHIREMLVSKIARETRIDRNDVARRVRFEERDDFRESHRVLVAVLPSPSLRLIAPEVWVK
jgi:glycosyltransferase A (GT-A) superfamily protein (DUF2064 family)